ncbi:hypothetical protein GS597_05420 [Synechococcales cyanobacterium C]|uniref:Vitamin K epoxide reductase domain-containing protein n=1 Tax=Petrachloros mirabilis ULC683 TaxID=2781853 RepID=A0A8K2A6K0_9CYAN|nr:vitamin K epoxide reductase family protein [Petrachloros mirabilis]NCJ05961.1 hypothetical protein [Petrachloros mirabilis ULC683]
MSRRRSKPWLHRWSRPIVGAIALLGALNTGYITATKLMGEAAACPTSGCETVLNSPYAFVLGQPLALFGFLAYVAMAIFALGPLWVNPDAQKDLRLKLENSTWLLLFLGSTAMMLFSFYLMYIMVTEFVVPYGPQAVCFFCIASAILATAMFGVTLLGRTWDDVGQLLFSGLIVAVITVIGTLGVYANVGQAVDDGYNIVSGEGRVFFSITETSGNAEIELARHLEAVDAKMYGAFWCPHCYEQKKLFGVEALADFPYIECAPEGQSPQVEVCQAAASQLEAAGGQFGYPAWEINGKIITGRRSLEELADLSDYQGPRDFKNTL